MEGKVVLVDTSILIEFFRKKDKSKTKLIELLDTFDEFRISSITEFEIYTGATGDQKEYWKEFLLKIVVLPFDSKAVERACEIETDLKLKNKQIGKADLFIAAIAMANNLPLATLNKKHFDRILGIQVVA